MTRVTLAVIALLVAAPAAAQTDPKETKLGAEFRREGEHLKETCGSLTLKAAGGCVVVLATGQPVHVALGSIAPQNGFGLGAAFVTGKNTDDWRLRWNADAVASPAGAWRAGVYMKSVYVKVPTRTVGTGRSSGGRPPISTATAERPVISAYFQSTSLPKLSNYGLGSESAQADKATYSMTQHVVGASTVWSLRRVPQLNLALLGEVNGRWTRVQSGLNDRSAVLQFGEGLRIRPTIGADLVRLNYAVRYKQFAGAGFQRWTMDLQHEIPLYHLAGAIDPRRAADQNGPDECGSTCESFTRNREGTISLRAYASRSIVSSGQSVPFYFQETIGGSNLAGERMLASYDDYRFRGPHVLMFQESIEHSLGRLPIGVFLLAEQGNVYQQTQGLTMKNLRTSFGAGLTIRAGGLPMVQISWATGKEGHHVAFTVNTSLLGGSSRPSFF